MTPFPKLRDFGFLARLGFLGLLLTLVGGIVTAMLQVRQHYAPRDQEPGLSMLDLEGAYHGVKAPSLLLAAIKDRNHPPELAKNKRDALVKWLEGNRVQTDYDNIDLGDFAPAEIIASDCLSCHGRTSKDPAARAIALDDWTTVKTIAFSKTIEPTPVDKVIVSAHAHMPALATSTLVLALLLFMTTYPRRLIEGLAGTMGVFLMLDFAGWWVARHWVQGTYLIVAAGGVYNAAAAVAILLLMIELTRPSLTPRS
jgi:hypothetical protein